MTDIPDQRARTHHDSPRRQCVCPRCGYRAERSPAVPCWSMRCPNCETPLVEVP